MTVQVTADFRGLLERAPSDLSVIKQMRELLGHGPGMVQLLADAVREIEQSIEESAEDAVARLQAGVGRLLLGHASDALEHLRQTGSSPQASYFMGHACLALGRTAKAGEHLQQAKDVGLALPVLDLELIDVQRQLGDLDGALAALDALPAEQKETAEFHYVLGACRSDQDEHLTAAEHLEKALELDPDHTGALFLLAWENDRHGNDGDALALYERCVRRPPVPTNAVLNLGILYEDQGRWDLAEKCYQRVLAAHPNHPRAKLYVRDASASETMFYDEEAEKRHDRFAAVLDVPVTDFELSVRSRNCLKKMNIKNLGDLTRTTEAQLLGSKNFGETSLREIKAMLQAKGLRLGQALEDTTTVVPGEPEQEEVVVAAPEEVPAEAADTSGPESVLNGPIDDLGLSVRSRKCMDRLNIQTIGDLINKTESQLMECKNFGATSMTEVRSKLSELGLSLRR